MPPIEVTLTRRLAKSAPRHADLDPVIRELCAIIDERFERITKCKHIDEEA
jgi:hypothetical protein